MSQIVALGVPSHSLAGDEATTILRKLGYDGIEVKAQAGLIFSCDDPDLVEEMCQELFQHRYFEGFGRVGIGRLEPITEVDLG